MRADEIANFLDEHLRAREASVDTDPTRLEVLGERPVKTVACAVDPCLAVLREAAGRGADMLVVRHGLGLGRPLVGSHRDKLAACLKTGLSVYAAGAALDCHPEASGSAQLAKALGLSPDRAFGRSRPLCWGLAAQCEMTRDELVQRVQKVCGRAYLLPAGPTRIRAVGVIAGRAEDFAAEASAARYDAVIAGETSNASAVDAEDAALNVILAGCQGTQVLAVRALTDAIAEKYGVESFFVAHASGL